MTAPRVQPDPLPGLPFGAMPAGERVATIREDRTIWLLHWCSVTRDWRRGSTSGLDVFGASEAVTVGEWLRFDCCGLQGELVDGTWRGA